MDKPKAIVKNWSGILTPFNQMIKNQSSPDMSALRGRSPFTTADILQTPLKEMSWKSQSPASDTKSAIKCGVRVMAAIDPPIKEKITSEVAIQTETGEQSPVKQKTEDQSPVKQKTEDQSPVKQKTEEQSPVQQTGNSMPQTHRSIRCCAIL